MQYDIPVVAPYRLDLTVSTLRRLPTNLVDQLTPDGHYVRAFGDQRSSVIARVSQSSPDVLTVSLDGDAGEHSRALALVRRTLGVDRDLSSFYQAADRIQWLGPLALRMRGVKPPCYPTLWEACVNAIVFQQVSLSSASSVVHRMIVALCQPIEYDGTMLYAFPSAQSFLAADDASMRTLGLSAAKLATLRRAGEAIATGALDQSMLEERESPDAVELLRGIKGIGPWTAAVILLRGFGRLDVFPMNDSGVARNLALIAGPEPLDIDGVFRVLGSDKGMLYYHLLLARLELRGNLGCPSVIDG